MNMHYIMKSINVLNCLLMLAVAASAYAIIVPFLNLRIQPTLPMAGITETAPTSLLASLPNPSQVDYAIIGEQNLFHPERIIPPDKKVEIAAVIPKPELVLYGTLISDNLSVAYVEDKKAPYSTPGRGKRQTQMKMGESVSGYILQEIEPNRIVLVKGEERLVVMLDSKDKKRAEETAMPAPGTSPPGSLPSSAAAASRPATPPAMAVPSAASQATAVAPAISTVPGSAQGEKLPAQPVPSVIRPGQPPVDPRRLPRTLNP